MKTERLMTEKVDASYQLQNAAMRPHHLYIRVQGLDGLS